MRVASEVIGGLGAVAGGYLGLVYVLVSLLLDLGGSGFNSFLFLWMGVGAGMAVSGGLGTTGAVFAIAGRSRTGAWLMLAGTTVAGMIYWLLLPLTQPPDVRDLYTGVPTEVGFYLLWLFPVPPLLVGAVLAFFAHRRAER